MSTEIQLESLRKYLSAVRDPETGRTLGSTNQIENLELDDVNVRCTVKLSTHSWPIRDELARSIEERLRAKTPELGEISVDFTSLDRPPIAIGQIGLEAKSVIAVGSGKGGVGKSTVATSLAIALSKAGAKVGLMDADVYGPSVPHLLGLSGRPEVVNNKMKPIYFERIPVVSMGFLVEPDQAVVWRGPMLHGAISQFLKDTYWGPLDYLIIDMPPGTGDIALTLSQMVPLTGAVVVCTPQEVALLDAIKAIAMFRTTKIPVLGMVENMSGFVCPDCGSQHDIFGKGGAREKAEEMGIPFLGEIPVNVQLRQNSDTGNLSGALEDPICSKAINDVMLATIQQINKKAATTPLGPALPVL